MQEAQYQSMLKDYNTLNKELKKEKKRIKEIEKFNEKTMIMQAKKQKPQFKTDKDIEDWLILENFLVKNSNPFKKILKVKAKK